MARHSTDFPAKYRPAGCKQRELLNTAHAWALLYEPTQQFPGVDIDAIYHRRINGKAHAPVQGVRR